MRKIIFALSAVAALGAVALAPTSASAHGLKFHGGWGWRAYSGPTYVVSNCYWVKRYTPFGVKFSRVCDY
jgi:hypothetical protein